LDLKSPGGPGNSDFESEGDESFIRTGPAYQSLSRRAVTALARRSPDRVGGVAASRIRNKGVGAALRGRTVGVAARGDSHGESRVAVLQVLIRELTWFRTDHVLIFVIRPDNGIWQTFMEPC
jgi:hypothetical protein